MLFVPEHFIKIERKHADIYLQHSYIFLQLQTDWYELLDKRICAMYSIHLFILVSMMYCPFITQNLLCIQLFLQWRDIPIKTKMLCSEGRLMIALFMKLAAWNIIQCFSYLIHVHTLNWYKILTFKIFQALFSIVICYFYYLLLKQFTATKLINSVWKVCLLLLFSCSPKE